MPPEGKPKPPVIVGLDGQALARNGKPAQRFVARRFALACDCGSENLVRFGPYEDGDASHDGEPADPGLRWVFTCQQCGNGVRFYATSAGWKARRAELAELLAMDTVEAQAVPSFTMAYHEAAYEHYPIGFEQGRLTFQRGETLPEDATTAQRHGYETEFVRVRELGEAEARGFERGRAAPRGLPDTEEARAVDAAADRT